nr:EARP-interacting protein homolog [Penaeus vannamei]
MDDAPVIYGLEDFQARALAAHTAETEKINFLVGTQSLRRTNQVQLIEFDDDTSLVTKQTFEHPAGEVWRICAAPQSVNLIATVYNNTQDYCGEFGAAIWRLPLEGSTSGVLDDTRYNHRLNLCNQWQIHTHQFYKGHEPEPTQFITLSPRRVLEVPIQGQIKAY